MSLRLPSAAWLLPLALLVTALPGAPALARAAGPGVDPARLSNARFYEKEAAEAVRRGTIDPLDYLDGVPWMIHFTKRGHAQLDYGQEGEACAVGSEAGKPGNWTLTFKCQGSGARTASWNWLDDKRARTDLFDAARPQGQERRWVEVQRLDRTFNAVLGEIEKRFSERGMAELAGAWKDEGGGKLQLPKKGAASFDGARWAARVLACQPEVDKPKLHLRCVELAGPEEKSVVFAALEEGGKLRLVEGALPPDPAGRFFERKQGGLVLSRAK